MHFDAGGMENGKNDSARGHVCLTSLSLARARARALKMQLRRGFQFVMHSDFRGGTRTYANGILLCRITIAFQP